MSLPPPPSSTNQFFFLFITNKIFTQLCISIEDIFCGIS
jgi:hypothetical protein